MRAYLTSFYGLPAGSAIPLALAQATTVLDLSDQNITDLTGITAFENLHFLTCSRNQLTVLPDLSGLDELVYLVANQNQLHTVGGLPASLLTLNLDSNQLTSLPDLSMASSLMMLIVSRNQLSGLADLDGLTNLETLDFNTNQVATLPTLPAGLTALFAGGNHLSDITSLGSQIFDILWLADNQLYDMAALTSLTFAANASLSISDNNLDTYDCEVIKNLLGKVPAATIYPQAYTSGCKKVQVHLP